jgi:hypothetical protein
VAAAAERQYRRQDSKDDNDGGDCFPGSGDERLAVCQRMSDRDEIKREDIQ